MDMIDLLDQAKITHVGGGTNLDEAKQPTYYIINGIKIGFVAASEGEQYKFTPEATDSTTGILTSYDTTEYNQVIADASKECDYLIAYVHWGTEDEDMYNSTQHGVKDICFSPSDVISRFRSPVYFVSSLNQKSPRLYTIGPSSVYSIP